MSEPETIRELELKASSGMSMACAKCRHPAPAEELMTVTLQVTVEGLALWNKSLRPERTQATVTPVCRDCAERMLPKAGQEITL